MNSAEIAALLAETAIASGVALVLALLLRKPLRARFGAAVAYSVWLLVPVALLAVLLPAATVASASMSMAPTLGNPAPQTVVAEAIATIGWAAPLLLVWAIGTLVTVLHFGRQQRDFRRSFGALRVRADGLRQAASTSGLPAALGLWRPQIVVPADFDRRYSREQQTLMQAHERTHIRRGDLHFNAAVAALRCLFWFNPLVHIAARHFRHDQELACDQRVIKRHPHSRRAYGEAMFKTQLATQPLPLGCHWGYSHPLKERIAMLKQPVPTLSRWIGGSAAVFVLTLLVGYGAWAAQPQRPAALEPTEATAPVPPAVPAQPDTPLPPPVPDAPGVPPFPQSPPSPPVAPEAPSAQDLPLPPPPPAAPGPNLLATLTTRASPVYPQQAIEQGVEGMVVLVVDVSADGSPTDVVIERSEPVGVFDQVAIDAVKEWRFNPEMKDGQPVASRVRVPVEFRIPKASGAAE